MKIFWKEYKCKVQSVMDTTKQIHEGMDMTTIDTQFGPFQDEVSLNEYTLDTNSSHYINKIYFFLFTSSCHFFEYVLMIVIMNSYLSKETL